MLTSILGSIGSSLLDTASTAATSAINYEFSKKLQENQYDLNQKSLRESPSNYRQGLEDAGYNPILAVTNGMSTPSVSGGTISGSSHSNTAQNYALLRNLDAQRTLTESQARNNDDQGRAAIRNADANTINANANALNAQTAQWQIVDARSEGLAGFEVGPLGIGGKHRMVQSLRINKNTGEAYDLLTGQKVQVFASTESHSAKSVPAGKVDVKMESYRPRARMSAAESKLRTTGR